MEMPQEGSQERAHLLLACDHLAVSIVGEEVAELEHPRSTWRNALYLYCSENHKDYENIAALKAHLKEVTSALRAIKFPQLGGDFGNITLSDLEKDDISYLLECTASALKSGKLPRPVSDERGAADASVTLAPFADADVACEGALEALQTFDQLVKIFSFFEGKISLNGFDEIKKRMVEDCREFRISIQKDYMLSCLDDGTILEKHLTQFVNILNNSLGLFCTIAEMALDEERGIRDQLPPELVPLMKMMLGIQYKAPQERQDTPEEDLSPETPLFPEVIAEGFKPSEKGSFDELYSSFESDNQQTFLRIFSGLNKQDRIRLVNILMPLSSAERTKFLKLFHGLTLDDKQGFIELFRHADTQSQFHMLELLNSSSDLHLADALRDSFRTRLIARMADILAHPTPPAIPPIFKNMTARDEADATKAALKMAKKHPKDPKSFEEIVKEAVTVMEAIELDNPEFLDLVLKVSSFGGNIPFDTKTVSPLFLAVMMGKVNSVKYCLEHPGLGLATEWVEFDDSCKGSLVETALFLVDDETLSDSAEERFEIARQILGKLLDHEGVLWPHDLTSGPYLSKLLERDNVSDDVRRLVGLELGRLLDVDKATLAEKGIGKLPTNFLEGAPQRRREAEVMALECGIFTDELFDALAAHTSFFKHVGLSEHAIDMLEGKMPSHEDAIERVKLSIRAGANPHGIKRKLPEGSELYQVLDKAVSMDSGLQKAASDIQKCLSHLSIAIQSIHETPSLTEIKNILREHIYSTEDNHNTENVKELAKKIAKEYFHDQHADIEVKFTTKDDFNYIMSSDLKHTAYHLNKAAAAKQAMVSVGRSM